MKLLGVFVDNLGLKLLALVMAWAIWYSVRSGLEEEADVTLRVRVEQAGDDLRAAATIDTVSVTVSGPKGDVAALSGRTDLDAVARVVPEYLREGQLDDTRDFGRDELEFRWLPADGAVYVTDMRPAKVRVKLHRMAVRNVPVEQPQVPTSAAGTVSVKVLRWDNVASIRAPESELRNITALRTFVPPERLQQIAGSLGDAPSITEDVRLDVDPSQAGRFEFTDRSVLTVKLELRRVEEGELVLPVRIYGSPPPSGTVRRRLRFSPANELDQRLRGVFQPDPDGGPPRLRIDVEGTPAALEAARAAASEGRLHAFVLEDDVPAGEDVFNLQVHVADLPVGVRPARQILLAVEVER